MLDPDFDMVTMAKPYVRRLLVRRYAADLKPSHWLPILERYRRLVEDFPDRVDVALRSVLPRDRVDERSVNYRTREWLSLVVVSSALVVGGALVLYAGVGPTAWGMSVIGLSGLLLGALLVGVYFILLLIGHR